ncbi:hypothetical protein CYD30_23525 [Kosakonia cowanii]|nr:hypothetical protein CYD30_23525 [Kosakonia cowanii]
MSGFEVFNAAGKLMIDSDNRSTLFYDNRTITNVTDGGFYSIPNPFGGAFDMGFLPESFVNNTMLQWIQLTPGKYGFLGAGLAVPNCGRMIRTSRNVAIQSGYMDVFNANGQLVWSAASASQMPRIRSFFDVPAGYDLQNNTLTVTPGFNPWILVNACPGNLSDDGEVVGFSGLVLRWTGSQLQGRYISQKQRNWSQTLQSRGMRIPLAEFVGV